MKETLNIFIVLFGLNAASATIAVADDYYQISITNLTRGQIFSPAVVATHRKNINLFEAGQPASPELAALAQDAVTTGLVDALNNNESVKSVAVGEGPTLPGKTSVIEMPAKGRFISLASMLVTTNDAFVGLNRVRITKPRRGIQIRVPAYDAGSEDNDESCLYIPGPPCGNPNMASDEPGEGYVHIHNGIHGSGDLNESLFDWRNPVASIRIRRIRK